MYAFYGERTGVGIARKHIGWYTKGLLDSAAFLQRVLQIPTAAEQRAAVDQFLAERESSSRSHSRSSELAA
jgi:tRNA-dihydrouridine synthase B